jgi:hypothetical protein
MAEDKVLVYEGPNGPRIVKDMPKEEIVALVHELMRMMEEMRQQHKRDIDMLAGF